MVDLTEQSLSDALELLGQFVAHNNLKATIKPTHALVKYRPRGREWLHQMLVGWNVKPSVYDRVMKLNPDGGYDGQQLRGWRRRAHPWSYDLVMPQQFIADQGIEAYRAMDRRWWNRGPTRKAMRRTDYLDHVWKFEFTATPKPFSELKRLVP